MSAFRRIAIAGLFVPILLGLGGCFNPFAPRIATTTGVYIPPPTPNSPQNVIRLFEWCWNNRDITLYRTIFTADFQFVFALGDSAGNQFRDAPVYRDVELDIATHLFVGGGAQAPASSIVLALDPTLVPLPDSRQGKNPRWHKEIATGVNLDIKTEDQQEYRITGWARFFVVRGDSALIPADLNAEPDSNRWYIDRWQDETLGGAGGTAVRPAGPGVLRATAPGTPAPAPRTWDAVRARPSAVMTTVSWGRLNALYVR